jgi:hypothetical protein
MPQRLLAAPIRKTCGADAAASLTRAGYVGSASAQRGGPLIQLAAKRLISHVDGVNRRAIAAVDPTVSASSRATRTRRCAASSRHAPAKYDALQLTIDVGVSVIWRRILPRVVAVSTLSDVGGVAVGSMSAPSLLPDLP